ncbi:hypothetical protein SCLCIDRAFT_1216931 [Scleroderma citrinum Foug A]|uniref:Uncharacterized protein n=1 Tax=Scleroderma citrinum Foug A TaxID=1036808 RepID=A0A0C3A6D7_9AGAM|nr:hypothetical protein SCLCIDRAFT_1216931 [Scleroderma citrinum Foug A]
MNNLMDESDHTLDGERDQIHISGVTVRSMLFVSDFAFCAHRSVNLLPPVVNFSEETLTLLEFPGLSW